MKRRERTQRHPRNPNTSKLKYLVALLGLALLYLFVACSSEDPTSVSQPLRGANSAVAPETTPTPATFETVPTTSSLADPTPTGQPSTLVSAGSAKPAVALDGTSAGEGTVDYYAFDPGSTLGDLFDTLSFSEQSCIEAEYSAAELVELKRRPMFDWQDVDGQQIAMLKCVEAEKLSGVFYSFTISNAEAQGLQLTSEQNSCLRRLVDRSDVLLVVGAYSKPSAASQRALFVMGMGVFSCVPELATSAQETFGEDESLVWTFYTDGWVLSAPAVDNGTVLVGSDDGSLYALSADSGKVLWSFETGDVVRSVPSVDDETVYFGSRDNHLYALEVATGGALWIYDTEDAIEYSPSVGRGMVYFPARGEYDRVIHAVDAATGEIVWVAEPPYPIDERLAPTVYGDRVYAQGAEYGAFYALDANTGEIVWQVEVGGYVESAPAMLDGVVYLTVINQAYAFEEAGGDLIWSVNTEEFPAQDFPALVVDGIYYLAPSDYVYALDAATGEEIWSYEAYELSSVPVVANGIFYGASKAEYLFALDAFTGEVLWTTPTEDFPVYSMSVVDGILYGQISEGFLLAVDTYDGSVIPWDFETGGAEDIRHYTVSGGMVYAAGPYNTVNALATPTSALALPDATTQPDSTPAESSTPTSSLEDVEMTINALPWVVDGLVLDEEEALIQLFYIASERPSVAWELAHKPWMQDGLSATEQQAISLLASIVRDDEESAERIVSMPFLEFIERSDLSILETLESLEGEGLRWLLSNPVLAEASGDVLTAEIALLSLEWEWPEMASILSALPWVEDGISLPEVRAVLLLRELALESQDLFRMLVSMAWTEDGLGRDETTVVDSLLGIAGESMAKRDEAAALEIAAMPFLESVDGVDAAAANSLRRLFWASNEVNHLTQVLAHPMLEDGISDDEAFVVAAFGIVVEHRPDQLDALLDLGPGVVDKRIVQLPLAGEVTLSVLNVNHRATGTMDILEQALRAQEEFMDVPFPRSYVGLLVADAAPHGGSGGPGGLINIAPEYAEDDYIIAHELSHTYWAFSPRWIAEGGADFMTTVSVGKRFSSDECNWADSLSALDSQSEPSTPTIGLSNCAYILGRGLFLDLYEELGDRAFRSGFGRLYVAMRDGELDDRCIGLERGLCYLRAAFGASAGPESAALAVPVIDRWYYGPRQ